MRTMKKFINITLIMLVMLIIYTGLTLAIEVKENPTWPAELGPKPQFEELEGKKIELTFWNFSIGMTSYFKAVSEEFEKLYPNIDLNIKYQEVPYEQIHQSLITSIIAGQGAPDILTINITETSKFFRPPFEDRFKEIKLNDKLKKDLIKQAPYRDSNGILRGVEVAGPHPCFLFYRKDLFEKAGIEMPINTWEEFIQAGLKMKEKLGIHITSLPITKNGLFQVTQFPVQNGNPIYNKKGEFVLNNERGVEAYKLVKDMVVKHKIAADAAPFASTTQRRLVGLQKDEIASTIGPLWLPIATIYNMKSEKSKGQWRVAPLPKFKNSPYRTSTSGGTSLSIVESQCEYPDLAEAFVKFTISSENQIRKFKEISYLPVLKSAMNSKEVITYKRPEIYGDQVVGKIFAEYATNLPDIRYSKGATSTVEEMRNRLGEIKDKSVKSWLDSIAEFAAEQQ